MRSTCAISYCYLWRVRLYRIAPHDLKITECRRRFDFRRKRRAYIFFHSKTQPNIIMNVSSGAWGSVVVKALRY